MLNSIRKFSNTLWAKILLCIVIVPFVFWGMGNVFSGGNKNIIAKINNKKISTQDFMNHINKLNINEDFIRQKLNQGILDEILNDLISQKLLEFEINDLNIQISDSSLSKIIKSNEDFKDENNMFSRIKYEKYLITNNMSSTMYEKKIRSNELQKRLLDYISGGTFSANFLIDQIFNEQNKTINVQAVNIEKLVKKKEEILLTDINKYIKDNKEKLLEKHVNFKYAKIDPLTLTSSNEFNELFFEKIDEMENEILNGLSYNGLIKNFNLISVEIKSYNKNINNFNEENKPANELLNKIDQIDEINEVNLIDNGNEYFLFVVNKIEKYLPDLNNEYFKNKIINNLINLNKYELNKLLIKKINEEGFNTNKFINFAKEKKLEIENIEIKNIRDSNFFDNESLKKIYNLQENKFTFGMDKKKQTYLLLIKNIKNKKISNYENDLQKYFFETNIHLKNNIYSSYDKYLSNKYKFEINNQTLERIKNYFK